MINVITKNPPKVKQVLNSQEELDRIPPDIINGNLFVELKGKLYSISDDIESIGQICDKQQQSSLEEYKSVLNNAKDELNNQTERILNDLKLAIDKKERETIPKYKNDLIAIKKKVQQLGKDLQVKEKELVKKHYDMTVLKEDDMFYTNQLSVAEELNMYLNYKQNLILKEKIRINQSESNSCEVEVINNRNNSCKNIKKAQNRVLSSNLLLTSCPVKHITKQFNLNEKIIAKNLIKNKKDLTYNKSKYFRLAAMSDNKYMSLFRIILDEVVSNCQSNQINKLNANLPKFKSVLYRSSSSVRAN